jgi:hypothetical protein
MTRIDHDRRRDQSDALQALSNYIREGDMLAAIHLEELRDPVRSQRSYRSYLSDRKVVVTGGLCRQCAVSCEMYQYDQRKIVWRCRAQGVLIRRYQSYESSLPINLYINQLNSAKCESERAVLSLVACRSSIVAMARYRMFHDRVSARKRRATEMTRIRFRVISAGSK